MTREELDRVRIHHESTYVAVLLTRIRDFCHALGITSVLHSEELADPDSHKTGCDAMLAFKVGSKARVALFEAKWPRLSRTPRYRWDRLQASSKISHFTDQLQRQEIWTTSAYIWEQFIVEHAVGSQPSPGFDRRGCSCVWQELAQKYSKEVIGNDHIRAHPLLWNDIDARAIVMAQCSCYGTSFADMIRWVLGTNSVPEIDASRVNAFLGPDAKPGSGPKELDIDAAGFARLEPTEGVNLRIPCSADIAAAQGWQELQSTSGLRHFLFIDTNSPDQKAANPCCENALNQELTELFKRNSKSPFLIVTQLLIEQMEARKARAQGPEHKDSSGSAHEHAMW